MAVHVTRMEFLRLSKNRALAERARDLLEEKRNILVMELLSFVGEIGKLQHKMDDSLKGTYSTLAEAEVVMGKLGFRGLSLSSTDRFVLETTTRSVVGVDVPVIELVETAKFEDVIPYGLLATSVKADEVVVKVQEALDAVVEVAEMEAGVKALATELKKLKRRVNALDHIIIPSLSSEIKFIRDRLEEMDRESFFRLKRIKQIMERRRAAKVPLA